MVGWKVAGRLIAITGVFGYGCAGVPGTVSRNDAAKSPTVEDFIAANLHTPDRVLIIRYTNPDPKNLSIPRDKLQTYCQTQGGNLERTSKARFPEVYAPTAEPYLGEFLCRKGDTKLWAVDIRPTGPAKYEGPTAVFFGNSPGNDYQVKLKVREISTAAISLTSCNTDEAKTTLTAAEDFLRNKLNVVPRIEDRSGFNKRWSSDALIEVSKKIMSECPSALSDVTYQVRINKRSSVERIVTYDVDKFEYFPVAYKPEGVTLTPTITIRSIRLLQLRPPQGFSDRNLQIEIAGIDGTSVRYRLQNLTDRYLDVEAVSVHINQNIMNASISRSIPPNGQSTVYAMEAPAGTAELVPVTLTADQARSRSVHIAVSAKYRLNDKTESLHREQRFTYAQLTDD
ncbi:MAG: hypothetical protein HY308_10230 [Gammaproteobacteria bacterium]|nr:hypothetical protein [Gammaproteobacteria bacterium]